MKTRAVIFISGIVAIAVVTIKSWIDDYRETDRLVKNWNEMKPDWQEVISFLSKINNSQKETAQFIKETQKQQEEFNRLMRGLN